MDSRAYRISIIILLAIMSFVAGRMVAKYLLEKKANDKLRLEVAVLSDVLKKTINEKGEQKARIAVLEADKAKDFLEIQSKDSVINKLQSEVKYYKKQIKNGGSVTVGGTVTTVHDTTEIHTIDSTSCFDYNNKWVDLWGHTIGNNLLEFGLTVRNEYTFTIGEEKGKPFVELTNKNPYTDTQYLRTFQVSSPKPKKFGIGFQAGIGVMSEFKLSPYIGAGVSYNFIRL